MLNHRVILDALVRLHEWRQSFNKDQYGLGFDQYKPDELHHYAEAYAMWGEGYGLLSGLTGDGAFQKMACQCGDWLLAQPNPGYRGLSWGLPWSWDVWKTPQTLSYVSTTSFVGKFLLELYEITGAGIWLDAAGKVADWIIKENKGVQTDHGLYLFYANFPPLQIPIVNSTALAGSFLARLYTQTQREEHHQNCNEMIRWVISKQRADGSWGYSDHHRKVDNIHTGFTLESLGIACQVSNQDKWIQAFMKGVAHYWNRLFRSDGYGWEKMPYRWSDLGFVPLLPWTKDQLTRIGMLRNPVPETRLWGYAAALRTFLIASQFNPVWLESALAIYGYLQQNLAQLDGSYAFRQGDGRIFIRHQAHLFNAFAHLAVSLDAREQER